MRRRHVIVGAIAALGLPLVARAETGLPVIGFLHSGAPEENTQRLAEYFKGLSETGFSDGRNVKVEYRWARGHNDKLPALARELVEAKVDVIATPASTPAAVAAKKATATIPIVFASGADAVALGLVASLSHPGGNVTGVTSLNTEIASKRLGLFRELVPNAARYYALVNPTSPLTAPFAKDLQAGAKTLGIEVELLRASTDAEIAAAIESAARPPGSVLIFASDSFFYIRREAIAKLAAARAVPTVFDVPEYVEAGGLMSYGSDFSDVMQIAGRYTGRILKGEKPADLPVTQSEKFKLALNLKTAKALNLTAPPILLAQADEVIE